jgi:hypothetical protein
MVTLRLTDAWSIQFGAMLGSDIFIDPADEPTGMASVKWAPSTGRDSVLFSVIVGPGRFNQERNFHNPEVFDLVWTHKCSGVLNYSFETLYGFTTNVPDIGFANWLGIVNYLTRNFTPRLDGTVRLEFFDDPRAAHELSRTVHRDHRRAVVQGATARLRHWRGAVAPGNPLRLQRSITPLRGQSRIIHRHRGHPGSLVAIRRSICHENHKGDADP